MGNGLGLQDVEGRKKPNNLEQREILECGFAITIYRAFYSWSNDFYARRRAMALHVKEEDLPRSERKFLVVDDLPLDKTLILNSYGKIPCYVGFLEWLSEDGAGGGMGFVNLRELGDDIVSFLNKTNPRSYYLRNIPLVGEEGLSDDGGKPNVAMHIKGFDQNTTTLPYPLLEKEFLALRNYILENLNVPVGCN